MSRGQYRTGWNLQVYASWRDGRRAISRRPYLTFLNRLTHPTPSLGSQPEVRACLMDAFSPIPIGKVGMAEELQHVDKGENPTC